MADAFRLCSFGLGRELGARVGGTGARALLHVCLSGPAACGLLCAYTQDAKMVDIVDMPRVQNVAYFFLCEHLRAHASKLSAAASSRHVLRSPASSSSDLVACCSVAVYREGDRERQRDRETGRERVR